MIDNVLIPPKPRCIVMRRDTPTHKTHSFFYTSVGPIRVRFREPFYTRNNRIDCRESLTVPGGLYLITHSSPILQGET